MFENQMRHAVWHKGRSQFVGLTFECGTRHEMWHNACIAFECGTRHEMWHNACIAFECGTRHEMQHMHSFGKMGVGLAMRRWVSDAWLG